MFQLCSTLPVRLNRDKLAWLALATLDEAIERAGPDPSPPSVSVRLSLAFLYAISDRDRATFDGFWKALRDPFKWDTNGSDSARAYLRRTYARTELHGICRAVGIELTAGVMQSLRRTWEADGQETSDRD